MKRLFLLGVVATVMFSMAACNNDDSDVGVSARRAEMPREVTVTPSPDGNMAIVSWVVGSNSDANYEIMRRMPGSQRIEGLPAQSVGVGSMELSNVSANPMQGGTFSWTGTGNTLSFTRNNNFDQFSVVIFLTHETMGGTSDIGVRSGHFDSINAMNAWSDIRWAETQVAFKAAADFVAANITLARASYNTDNDTQNAITGNNINLRIALGMSVNSSPDPTFTRVEWSVQDQNGDWQPIGETFQWNLIPAGQTGQFRVFIRHGRGMNSYETETFNIYRP